MSPKTILIVEDNRLNMKLLEVLLEGQSDALIKTTFGLEAVTIARQTRRDLILLDIQLPDLSGFDVARRLKADAVTRSIPIMAVTAFAEPEHEQKAIESGCDGYMVKPIRVTDFLREVANFLSR
jgi:two-component system cell cycle response regulator DivK